MGVNHLWRVTCVKTAQKVPVGLTVGIVKSGTTAIPSAKEIKAAIKAQRGIDANEGLCNRSYFDMVDMSKK